MGERQFHGVVTERLDFISETREPFGLHLRKMLVAPGENETARMVGLEGFSGIPDAPVRNANLPA
jgi:hypothetical protein